MLYEYDGNMLGAWILLGVVIVVAISFIIYKKFFFERKKR